LQAGKTRLDVTANEGVSAGRSSNRRPFGRLVWTSCPFSGTGWMIDYTMPVERSSG
jgi:hypothetical protein